MATARWATQEEYDAFWRSEAYAPRQKRRKQPLLPLFNSGRPMMAQELVDLDKFNVHVKYLDKNGGSR